MLVSAINATNRQLDQIVDLQYKTWFFEFIALNNSAGLSVEKYLLEHFIRPRLSFTTMLLDKNQNVAGFTMGSSHTEQAKLNQEPAVNVNYREYENRPQMRQFLTKWSELELPDDFLLHIFSVRSDLQGMAYPEFGNRKVSDILMEETFRQARIANCKRIISALKRSNHNSYNFFVKKNKGNVILEYDMSKTVFNDKFIGFAIEIK